MIAMAEATSHPKKRVVKTEEVTEEVEVQPTLKDIVKKLKKLEKEKADKCDVEKLRKIFSSLQIMVNDALNSSDQLQHDEMSDEDADGNAATNTESDTPPQTPEKVRDDSEEQEAIQVLSEGATSAQNDKPLNKQPSTSQNYDGIAVPRNVLNVPLSHGNEAAMDEFKIQLNEFLVCSNITLLKERKKLIKDLRDTKITDVEQFKNFFTVDVRKQHCDTEAKKGKIVFDPDDGVELWTNKRDWTCVELSSFRRSSEYDCPRVRSLMESLESKPEQLWPDVYSKYKESAASTTWRLRSKGAVENTTPAPFPSWISDDCFITGSDEQRIRLRRYLHASCQQFTNSNYLEAKYAVYYLVIRHQNYDVKENGKKFTNQSKIQVYVGCATNGVKTRWSGRCRCVKEVIEATRNSTSVDQLIDGIRIKPYQLVDAFLALAWLCKFNMALFVVKTFENSPEMKKYEKDLIREHAAASSDYHGLNVKG